MHAVILVAGRGERLRPLTNALPKSLIPIAEKPILGRLLEALDQADVRTVTLVIGYRAGRIRKYVMENFAGLRVQFVRNPIYARTNTLYSLSLAKRTAIGRTFLLIDGDLALEPRVLWIARRFQGGNAIFCDSSTALDSEAVRASGLPHGRITNIGKEREKGKRLFGESIGLARIDRRDSRKLFLTCGEILRNKGHAHYYEAAFQRMIEQGAVFRAVDIKGAKWAEIDSKRDLQRARTLFSTTQDPAK